MPDIIKPIQRGKTTLSSITGKGIEGYARPGVRKLPNKSRSTPPNKDIATIPPHLGIDPPSATGLAQRQSILPKT
jgi:hypothetical protein